jgi:hypothetical protein
MSPLGKWDRDLAHRSLDELLSLTRQYKPSSAYRELLEFVARFRFYAPFNAMLTYVQMPGARFVRRTCFAGSIVGVVDPADA